MKQKFSMKIKKKSFNNMVSDSWKNTATWPLKTQKAENLQKKIQKTSSCP